MSQIISNNQLMLFSAVLRPIVYQNLVFRKTYLTFFPITFPCLYTTLLFIDNTQLYASLILDKPKHKLYTQINIFWGYDCFFTWLQILANGNFSSPRSENLMGTVNTDINSILSCSANNKPGIHTKHPTKNLTKKILFRSPTKTRGLTQS